MSQVLFEPSQWQFLCKVCEEGYPKEVCGLLFGRSENPSKSEVRVDRVEVLANILNGKHMKRLTELLEAGAVSINKERALKGGNYEFLIDPQEHYEKISKAMKDGFDQVGVFHSHPDHPAEPSPTDASQPFLVGWSNIIVAVHEGKFKEARSWIREAEDSPFKEEKIFVQ